MVRLPQLLGLTLVGLALLLAAPAARGQEPLPPIEAEEVPPPDITVRVPQPVIVVPRGVDLALDAAVQISLERNPLLRRAAARVAQARGKAQQAGLYPNPIQNSGNPVQLGGQNSTYSSGIVQEVVRGGKLDLDVAAARWSVTQEQWAFQRQRFELITAVRQQFYAVLAVQERMAIYTVLRAAAEVSSETTNKMFQAGEVRTSDVLQMRIELRRAEAASDATKVAVEASRRQLAALIGEPDLLIDRVHGDLTPQIPRYELQRLSAAVLARNPQVQIARVGVLRSQVLLDRARAEVIPNLNVNAGYQYTVNAPHSQALVGLYFEVPIWDRNQGNIRAAAAAINEAAANIGTTQNELLQQVADAHGRLLAAQHTIDAFERSILPDANESLNITRQALEQGQTDILHLLQAQRSLFEANLDYLQAQINEIIAAAEIAGLLQEERFP